MSLASKLIEFTLRIVSSIRDVPVIKGLLQFLAVYNALAPSEWPRDYVPQDGEYFDFIVVGAGSGGATVAARLSEIPHWNVLLIEAGGDPPYESILPSAMPTIAHSAYDWDYKAKVDRNVGRVHINNTIPMARGKMLGGSSSSNYHFYVRGKPDDFEAWNKIAPGWDWLSVLPYFKKIENMLDLNVLHGKNYYLHSTKGPLKVSRLEQNKVFQDISDKLLESFEDIGIPRILEMNGVENAGASIPHFSFANGRRSSTAEAYLLPAKDRINLRIAKFSLVTKVLLDDTNTKVIGVEIINKSGNLLKVLTKKEVILSAGAINTPKILLLSGIGPTKHLEQIGIKTRVNLPVGKNLQDHYLVTFIIKGEKGIGSARLIAHSIRELDNFPAPVQTGYYSLNNSYLKPIDDRRPMFQFFNAHSGAQVSPLLYLGCRGFANFDHKYCLSIANSNAVNEIEYMATTLLHPESRGEVKLKSRDPLADPIINLGYFKEKVDLLRLSEGLKFLLNIVKTPNFKKVDAKVVELDVEACKNLLFGSDEYWECYTRNAVTTILHPVGTCAMGPDGVVNGRLKVHGFRNLRVIDASVMPLITSGNTNAPTIMIGERGADLIKMDHLKDFEMDMASLLTIDNRK